MRRLAALLLVLPVLAACDSTEPGDDLVGVWTVSSIGLEYVVTSRTAQTVPDFTAAPSGAISVSGAVNRQLRYVDEIYGGGDGFSLARFTAAAPGSGPLSELTVSQFGDQSNVSFYDEPTGRDFRADFQGRPSFRVQGTSVEVATSTLYDGSGSVSVSGALTFPGIALAAGEPTAVPAGTLEIDDLVATYEFEEGGTFTATSFDFDETTTISGTWEATDDGRLRVSTTEGSVTQTTAFTYEVSGSTLRLTATGLGGAGPCTGDCLRQVEGQIFAATNSLTAVSEGLSITLRSGRSAAAARPAPEGARRARPIPPAVPFLGRR